jgi:hypothetical protein
MNLERGAVLVVLAACTAACSSSSPDDATMSGTGGSIADGSTAPGGGGQAGITTDARTPLDSTPPVDTGTTKPPSDSATDATPPGTDAARPNASPKCTDVAATVDLTSSAQPAPPAAGANVSFLTDWVGLSKAGGYNRIQVMDACRMQADGTKTSHGLPAVRVEVRPGDDPLDLGANSERAEALIMQDASGTINESAASGTQYYATSYYFPATWDGTFLRGNSNSWSFVTQFHGSGSALAGGLTAGRHTATGPQIYQLSGGGQTFDLSNNSISKDKWTDLVFMYTWASTATGHITVYRRDEGQTKFTQVLDAPNIATMPSASETYYWKQGLYRGGDVSGRVDIFWIGPTARASTFAAAELAAFGSNDGS